MRGSTLAARAVILWAAIACLAVGACNGAPDDRERTGAVASALENGTADSSGAFPAVGVIYFTGVPTQQMCSGSLIWPDAHMVAPVGRTFLR